MSKKRRSTKKLTRPEVHHPPAEAQSIESLTIFWSLTIFATLVIVVVILLMRGSLLAWEWSAASRNTLIAFSDLLLFTAVITGSVGGILTPIVQSQRRRKAPRPLQLAAIAIALSPWLLAAILVGRS